MASSANQRLNLSSKSDQDHAPLLDSFKAFAFQTGIDRMCEAYRASVVTLEKAQREAQGSNANYDASDEDDLEDDEDGILIHSTRHALNYDEMGAILAVTVVREAFITSALHYWDVPHEDGPAFTIRRTHIQC